MIPRILILAFAALAASPIANALVHNGPRATDISDNQGFDYRNGWSPAPTAAPKIPLELMRRGFMGLEERDLDSTVLIGSDKTCGYLSGSAGAAYTCGGTGLNCNFFPAVQTGGFGAIGCCDTKFNCGINLYCIDSADFSASCNDVCQANTFTAKCTAATAPFCNTAYFPQVNVQAVYCAESSVSTRQTILTTYPGQEIGGTFSPFVLTSQASSTAAASSISSISSISSPIIIPPSTTTNPSISTTTSPVPSSSSSVPGKPTPVGAIAGGTVGGVAVLAAIGFGIFFLLRRRNSSSNTPANPTTYQEYQPPPQQQPVGGAGGFAAAGGKPPMQQHDYNAYSQQPQPAPQYYPQGKETLAPTSPELDGTAAHNAAGGNSPHFERQSVVSPTGTSNAGDYSAYPSSPSNATGGGYAQGEQIYEAPGHEIHH